MVLFVGCEWHHGGAQDKVRRRMEERGDTEPGELQTEYRILLYVMGTPKGGSSSGGKYRKDASGPKRQTPSVFLEGIEAIRAKANKGKVEPRDV